MEQAIVAALASRGLLEAGSRCLGKKVPPALALPHPEVQAALALAAGCLDCSCAVLASPGAHGFWRAVACLEVAAVIAFALWFAGRGAAFARAATWRCWK